MLREFAERGTIAATAAALGYTPSAVSQQLAALEREAGAVLLDRTARAAELTDAGRRLADHAERILGMIEAAVAVPSKGMGGLQAAGWGNGPRLLGPGVHKYNHPSTWMYPLQHQRKDRISVAKVKLFLCWIRTGCGC